MYCPTESVDWCQCCQQGVTFADLEGSSDFFGNYNAAQVVHPTDDTSSFHIYLSPYFTNYDAIICKREQIILADLLFTLAML